MDVRPVSELEEEVGQDDFDRKRVRFSVKTSPSFSVLILLGTANVTCGCSDDTEQPVLYRGGIVDQV